MKFKINGKNFFLAVLPAVVLLLFATIFILKKSDSHHFKAGAARLLAKSKALVKKARGFNQEEALKTLGKTPFNGFFFRFDDGLGKAKIHTGSAAPPQPRNPYLINFEFKKTGPIPLQSREENFSISPSGEGILKIKHVKKAYFEAPVKIPYRKLGGIEIRAKHGKGKLMQLGWDRNPQKNIENTAAFTDIPVIPGNKFHTYTIDAGYLKRKLGHLSTIKKIYLFASDTAGDHVEIDYIRFIKKKGHYLRQPAGTAYETINKETRKVLFTQTPLSLTYELELPAGDRFIRFGMGIIENNDPVTFKILVDGSEIFSKTVVSSKRWQDAMIDMGAYAGKKLRIALKTESGRGNIAFWSNPILYAPPEEKFNIIIVLEDALRADHMSCYGYDRKTTPFKEKLAKRGVLFLNSFAQAVSTRPSCVSIMTSLYPTATKACLHENYLTLAEILRYTGFQTASFIQNPNAGSYSGLHQGYGYLIDSFDLKNLSGDMYGSKVIDWIKNHGHSNYFLYLHLVDPHGPYNPPGNFRRWFKTHAPGKSKLTKTRGLDPDWIENPTIPGRRALYDGEIKNNDFYFQRFISALKKLNVLDHTLIIFISDHGEHLGEHNLWMHRPPSYVQVIKTPMIMVYPGKLPPGRIVAQPVQNIDVVPTILDLAGINKDSLLLAGDSLLPLIRREKPDRWNNRVIIADEAVNRLNLKGIREFASIIFKDTHILISRKAPMRQFNYLHDRQETNGKVIPGNLNKFYRNLCRKLHENNFQVWKAVTGMKTRREKYDPKTIEKLKSLGYLQ